MPKRPAPKAEDPRVPAGYDPDQYPSFAVTVDAVVLSIVDGQLHILVIQRDHDPFQGAWALPGGFKRPDETLDDAVARELREETGLDAAGHLVQLGAYGDPGRDPRLNVVTVAYRAAVADTGQLVAATDARAAELWPVGDILSGRLSLAFDHLHIVRDAVERTRIDLQATDLATAFVGSTFTLSQLRSVFEAVWEVELDPANFRRTVLGGDPPHVLPTGKRGQPGPEGGRPPELYRVAWEAWLDGAPLDRPQTQKSRLANKKLFAQLRALRKSGRLDEALELCPPHWTNERAALLAELAEQEPASAG